MKAHAYLALGFLVFAFALLVLLGGGGCHPLPPLDPNDPSATCETACTNVREMGCTDWVNTPKLGYCTDVCDNAFKNGGTAWPVRCISAAKSCDEANRCR